MGAVFRALDLRLDRHVALKILPPEQTGDPEVVQRFYQEARAAARLDHENIARVYSIGGDKSYHFIAFEYIEGTTIRQRVQAHGALSVAESINYTLQIAGALVHATERGVVHRDIKPSNIIVTAHGRAKLVDMGLARRFERGGAEDDGLTQSGMTLGTFDYISPEQARDPRDVDVRSDLYSLGCTLFYMLTGRPPFPDGTVLQKLIQHQEEPAPDVRIVNPHVPADLAAIILKLMAKDRDRRYQTPEQLVRDLLTIAGALGLRSISPEGLVWMSASPQPAWERHLVWGVPVLALVLVVTFLIWWGQTTEPTFPPASDLASAPQVPTAPATRKQPAVSAADAARVPAGDRPPETTPAPKSVVTARPARDIVVRAGDDLAELIADAPSGSTLILADDGPFDVRPGSLDNANPPSNLTEIGHDVSIRAAEGARPILRASKTLSSFDTGAVLLRFGKGRVILDGLEFQLDPGERDRLLAAIIAEGTDLTIQRCAFRRTGSRDALSRTAAVRIRTTPSDDTASDRPAPVLIRETFFDVSQVGVWVQGPADINVRDCTFGPADTSIWLDNSESVAAVPSRLNLSHVSFLAGEGAVFRLAKAAARIRMDDSVVAPPLDTGTTLVISDDPERLDWFGRANLYAAVTTFLQPTRDLPGRLAIRRFDAWADGPLALREVESDASVTTVWDDTDPIRTLAKRDPTSAFTLRLTDHATSEIGARRTPWGTISAANARLVAQATPRKEVTASRTESRTTPVTEPVTPPTGASPLTADGSTKTMPPMELAPMPQAPGNPPPMIITPAPMNVAGAPMDRKVDDASTGRSDHTLNNAASDNKVGQRDQENGLPATPVATPDNPDPSKASVRPDVIRTADRLLEALRNSRNQGAKLLLAADADIELPSCDLPGNGRWVLQAADKGIGRRPRIHFRPARDDARAASQWTMLFKVRAGALELQGIDIVLSQADAPATGRWAAFGVWAGADLNLIDCTVTIEGNRPRSAAISVQAAENEAEIGIANSDPSAASIRSSNSLFRCGGDLVDVAPGRRLDLNVSNLVIATGGGLVHGHGVPRGQMAEPLRLSLRQVTARNYGGLVLLESAPGEPDLPIAEVTARECIFATTAQGAPLFRVDGQDNLDGLQDRIRWEGHGVAYHQIDVYRRDQTAQPGHVPRRFDRASWEVAVGSREDAPYHGDIRFAKPWDDERSAWTLTLDDVRVDPQGQAPAKGPDLTLIPEPPLSN
jgi:serine/threonine-protein kinase